MGNSEVGHLNLGAGAIVPQDLARIDKAVEDGTLAENETLQAALKERRARAPDRPRLDGGVHSSDRPPQGADRAGGRARGRRTSWSTRSPTAATPRRPRAPTLPRRRCESWGAGRVGSVVGRYFAMDRDQRWDRTEKALDAAARRQGRAPRGHAASRRRATPTSATRPTSSSRRRRSARRRCIRPGDSVHRVQLPARPDAPDHARSSTRDDRPLHDADRVRRGLGLSGRSSRPSGPRSRSRKVIADHGKRQLHVAETEKYPHVTYFFNGGEEHPYEGEMRELVPSPRDVPTYDHKPEMSAREATDAFVSHWREDEPAFAIINFANPDMVGHTGVIPAAVKAVETVDECLGRVVEAVHDERRRVRRHRRPRQLRPHARGGRLAQHRALAQPGAVHRHRRRRRRSTARASWPTSRRPRSRCSGSTSRRR